MIKFNDKGDMTIINLEDLTYLESALFANDMNRKIEALAKLVEKFDLQLANKIRDKGLPETIYCGETIYPILSKYYNVICQPLCGEDKILISWMKKVNILDYDLEI